MYLKDMLTSEKKQGDVLHWGMIFVLVSTEEKFQILSKLFKIQFEKDKSIDKEEWHLIHRGDNLISCNKNLTRIETVFCSLQENKTCSSLRSHETLNISVTNYEKTSIRWNKKAKKNLIYDTKFSASQKSHYLNIQIALPLKIMVVPRHLKVKVGFGMFLWLILLIQACS